MGRFLNADAISFLGATGTTAGYNLYAYCENDPVNDSDVSGMLSSATIIRFIKTLGVKALKMISAVWKSFVKPGKINLKPFEIVIDAVIAFVFPSFGAAFKLITYKAVNRELVQIVFKKSGKSLVNFLTKFGMKIGLNSLFSTAVNNLIFKHMSRFLPVGGIVCLLLDAIDKEVDYWFNYAKVL